MSGLTKQEPYARAREETLKLRRLHLSFAQGNLTHVRARRHRTARLSSIRRSGTLRTCARGDAGVCNRGETD